MANRFWVGDGGNWSDNTNHWSTSDGGGAGASKPTSSDSVFFTANSFTSGSQTVTLNEIANCLDMDWTGTTDTPAFAMSNKLNIYGSLTFIAAMTQTGASDCTLKSTSTGKTITTNGLSLVCTVVLDGSGGEWTLQDALTTSSDFYHKAGSLLTNDQTLTIRRYIRDGAGTKVATFGSSVINISSLGGDGWQDNGSNFTLNAGTSTIKIAGTGDFDGEGKTYYNVELNGTAHTISGNNTFNRLTIGRPGAAVAISGAVTCTVTELSIPIVGTTVVTITNTDFIMALRRITTNYLTLSGSAASGGASFYAGAYSTDGGGNSGWMFREPVGAMK